MRTSIPYDVGPVRSGGPADRAAWRRTFTQIVYPSAMAAAVFSAAAPALNAYRVQGATYILLGASVLSTLIGFGVAKWWHKTAVWSYAMSLAGLAAFVMAVAGSQTAQLAHQFVQGPNRLITETLPLSGPRSIMTSLICLVWVCGAVLSEMLTRIRASRAVGAVGMAFPIALFILTYSVASAAPSRNRWAGPALLIALIVLAVIRRYDADTSATLVADSWADGSATSVDPGLRHLVIGLIAAGLVIAGLYPVVGGLPGMSGHPASLHRTPSVTSAVVVDPVDAMADLRDGDPSAPAHQVMTVRMAGPSTGYMAMAVLDTYDGATWRFDATFTPTGGRIPSAPGGNPSVDLSSTVDQDVHIEAPLPIPFLPALDRPVEVQGLDVVSDQTSGMLLATASAAGSQYTVMSRATNVTLQRLPGADGIFSDVSASDRELPSNATLALATSLRFLASLSGQRPTPTVAFLQAATTALHSDERRVDPTVAAPVAASSSTVPPSKSSSKKKKSGRAASTTTTTVAPVTNIGGTSLSEVIQAVTIDREATPEQFATFIAMAARDLGIPARVVTGFRLVPSSVGGPLAAGLYQVTNRQSWTWVEIPVAGVGWVVLDPTPDAATGALEPPPQQVQAPATTLAPLQANAVPRGEITGAHALAHRANIKVPHATHRPVWDLVLLALAGLLLVVLLVGPGQASARRAWRRRSRRSSDPAERTVGAWLEMLDGLDCAGMRPTPGLTNSEIAAEAGIHFGPQVAEPLVAVGRMAERAIFATGGNTDPETANRAWALRREMVVVLRGGMDRRQRFLAKMMVGSGPRRPSDPPGRGH